MANDYYNDSGAPSTGSSGSSATIRGEFDSIQQGFDKLPALIGGGGLPVFVNDSETGLETLTAEQARTKLGIGSDANWCGTAGGTANALELTPGVAIDGYVAGQTFLFKSGPSQNSGVTTVQVSGFSAINVQVNGAACTGGEIAANMWYAILVDASLTSVQMWKIGRATLTELGISAFAQTILDDSDAAAVRATLGTISIAGDNLTGALNDKRSTVAATDTTTPLWTQPNGKIQDWTGTPTITDFPAAAQAGSQREVYPAAGAIMTHGGNISVQGNASVTAAAGDKWVINAITVNTFYVEVFPKNALPLLRSYLAGLGLSTTGPSNTMSIAAGVAADSTNAVMISLPTAISKTTAAWAVGTGNGGLDAGTIANNTGYHFFEIMRPDTAVVDVIFSLSATAPTLPASYTKFRRLGWAKTNGSGQWNSFVQIGDEFFWGTPILDFDGAGSTAARLLAISVPSGVNVKAIFNIGNNGGASGSGSIYLSSPDVADLAPAAAAAPLASIIFSGAAGTTVGGMAACFTNTSAQIRHRESNAEIYRIATLGWIDTRGRDA